MCVGQRLSSGQHVCRGWRTSTTSVSMWIWPQHVTYCDLYNVCCVQKYFCAGFYMIFDGYSDGLSTKGVEQERRAMKVPSSDIHFAEDMPVTIRQERFFKERGYVYPCIG